VRIALVISTLGPGGAERVMSIMANYWASRGREVFIITLSSEGNDWYELHPNVKRVGLSLLSTPAHIGEALRSNLQRMKRLRHEIRKSGAEVVISFVDGTNVLTLFATFGLGVRVIVSERIDARRHRIGWIRSGLRYLLYPQAEALVVQSAVMRDWARKIVKEKDVRMIPNPVAKPSPVEKPGNGTGRAFSVPSTHRTIVAMGRLTRQKGFDLLLQAFGRCAVRHPEWSVIILGEGEDRHALEALIGELSLKDRVSLPGRVRDPGQILAEADLFVMSSRYEGFPNALLEAMACGLAVIATDCPSGPRDIIREGVDGILVPLNDLDALASSMDRLMEDQTERQRLGANAVKITERFSVEKIMSMWDDLLVHTRRPT
jgi:GalNAc-alpha-(1->4)-GalNAc-alpha-(1->3)-diNAcBac-PP-undecaprenol alpha-1,4-N-acetyl-D-galactosaminyltransferase